MNSRKLGQLLAALTLASAVALTGCSSQSDQSITVYSGRSEALIADLLESFSAETGVEVQVRYGDTAELATQILEEGSNIRADVFFSQDAGALGALAKAGVLKQLPEDLIGLVPSEFRSTQQTWVGVSGRARVLVFNPEKVLTLPQSYKDLMDPSWQGRIGISPNNASFQAFVTAVRVIEGEQAAIDFLAAMKKNAVLFEKNSLILEAVENGVIDAGLINHYYWYELAKQKGTENMVSKLSWFASGDVGNLVNLAGVALLSDDPNALAFARWLMGPSAQQYFVNNTSEYSLTGLPPVAGLIPLAEIKSPKIDLSDLDSLAITLELIQKAGLL